MSDKQLLVTLNAGREVISLQIQPTAMSHLELSLRPNYCPFIFKTTELKISALNIEFNTC